VPTETAELIVNFPPGLVPAEKDIRLEAWTPEAGLPRQDMKLTQGTYCIDSGETAYLARQGAVRYLPELNQVSAVIRHPQPATAYTLRWSLREGKHVPRETPDHRRLVRALTELTAWQHDRIETSIGGALCRGDVQVKVLLYEPPSAQQQVGVMKIVQPRDADHSAYVGRGIVGQAFRSRLVKYFNSKPSLAC